MSALRRFNLAWAGMMLLAAGCATSPWSAAQTADANLAAATQAAAAQPIPLPTAPGAASPGGASPETLNQIMAELQSLGAVDPAAQAKLTEDLKQTDPSLWPLVMQQFRAAMAYKQRNQERAELATRPAPPITSTLDVKPAPPSTPAPPSAWPAAEAEVARRTSPQSPADRPSPKAPPSSDVGRLPPADNTALPPSSPPVGRYPSTGQPPLAVAAKPLPAAAAKPAGEVIPASYEAPPARDWRSHLAQSIAAMETEVKSSPQSTDEIAMHERLRLLYLAAGRREDALRPVPAVSPTAEAFWANEVAGLSAWLDTQRTVDRQRRAVEAKQHFGEALASLGAMAPLTVRNLEFCTAVYSYGALKRFDKREFVPNQELLLYAEVDNFKSEQTPSGHHTVLRGSYQIFDSSGHQVATHEFAKTEETCDSPRRDFFIGYHLRLPRQIYPGKHTLKLTIEDTLSQKIGQASIDFSIKQARE